MNETPGGKGPKRYVIEEDIVDAKRKVGNNPPKGEKHRSFLTVYATAKKGGSE